MSSLSQEIKAQQELDKAEAELLKNSDILENFLNALNDAFKDLDDPFTIRLIQKPK